MATRRPSRDDPPANLDIQSHCDAKRFCLAVRPCRFPATASRSLEFVKNQVSPSSTVVWGSVVDVLYSLRGQTDLDQPSPATDKGRDAADVFTRTERPPQPLIDDLI